MTIYELVEYQKKSYAQEVFSSKVCEKLWKKYGQQVDVEVPSMKNDWQWQLTSQGWVGHIVLEKDLHFALLPKVDLANLFYMLEYAYQLKQFRFLKGLVDCKSLDEFYENLASVLASRILDRARKGFYRTYLGERDQLPYVRGRLDIRKVIQKPWETRIQCEFEEHTPDIEENQILLWTMGRITRSGLCSEKTLYKVRSAYRVLQKTVALVPFNPQSCVGRLYNRLNDDYHSLHALCRFFLEHSGPSHELGDKTMLPFLVDMEKLFERFVAEWLIANLPDELRVKFQEIVNIDHEGKFHFRIDLVISEKSSGVPVCVIDTKYKAPDSPSMSDVAQVIAYAEAKGCREAILVYPIQLQTPINEKVGRIHVRCATFSLDGDLEEAGKGFLKELFGEGGFYLG